MKKNFLFGLIGAGALILSGSVGFAAWTIKNSTDSKEDPSLKLTADATVNDESLQLGECKWTDSVVEFKPVKKTGVTYSYSWLSASDVLTEDNLTAVYEIKGKASANANININASFTDSTTASESVKTYSELTKLSASTGKGIVDALPKAQVGSTGSETGSVTADGQGSFSASISVTFGWGFAFGGNNPYEYYNSKKYSVSLAGEAKTNIGYLSYLPKCSFTLSVKVSLAS